MTKKRVLTGITTTGIPHLGNYVGAIRPAIRAAEQENVDSYLFLANYHGIIKCHEPEQIHQSTQAVAATWLACGLDTERTTFYRQSDIPEILELNWILTCITGKGLMNRAHAYKAAVDSNKYASYVLAYYLYQSKIRPKILHPINIYDDIDVNVRISARPDIEKVILENKENDDVKRALMLLDEIELIELLNDYAGYESALYNHQYFEDGYVFNYFSGKSVQSYQYEKYYMQIFKKFFKNDELLQKEIDTFDKKLSGHHELKDLDAGIEMGLYSYPILMTADILMFQANEVPVGRDQVQHVEMARDIAQRFNHRFGVDLFTLPEAKFDEHVELLVGLDGRKMSKSYGNTIELFLTPKQRQKAVNKIVTNLKEPSVPKFKGESAIFEIYQAFATPAEYAEFEKQLNEGLAWGEAKKLLAAKIGDELDGFTDIYHDLIANPQRIEDILQAGASKARVQARELLTQVKDAVGIRSLA